MKYAASLSVLLLGASLFVTMPVLAQDEEEQATSEQAATEDQAATEEQAADEEVAEESNLSERICRRVHVTGSHIPQRICMSRAEWTELREESQQNLQDHERAMGNSTSATGEGN